MTEQSTAREDWRVWLRAFAPVLTTGLGSTLLGATLASFSLDRLALPDGLAYGSATDELLPFVACGACAGLAFGVLRGMIFERPVPEFVRGLFASTLWATVLVGLIALLVLRGHRGGGGALFEDTSGHMALVWFWPSWALPLVAAWGRWRAIGVACSAVVGVFLAGYVGDWSASGVVGSLIAGVGLMTVVGYGAPHDCWVEFNPDPGLGRLPLADTALFGADIGAVVAAGGFYHHRLAPNHFRFERTGEGAYSRYVLRLLQGGRCDVLSGGGGVARLNSGDSYRLRDGDLVFATRGADDAVGVRFATRPRTGIGRDRDYWLGRVQTAFVEGSDRQTLAAIDAIHARYSLIARASDGKPAFSGEDVWLVRLHQVLATAGRLAVATTRARERRATEFREALEQAAIAYADPRLTETPSLRESEVLDRLKGVLGRRYDAEGLPWLHAALLWLALIESRRLRKNEAGVQRHLEGINPTARREGRS